MEKPKVNVDSILVNGKIKYKDWKELTAQQRGDIIDQINDECYDMDILDLIAPLLQSEVFPENHASIQLAYTRENRLQPRSRESIDVAKEAISKELVKLREEIQELKESKREEVESKIVSLMESSSKREEMMLEAFKRTGELMNIFSNKERTGAYFGWNLEPGFRYKLFYEDENYKVLEDYNYNDNIIRYTIEPIKLLQNPEGYFHSLKHVMVDNLALRDLIQRQRPTITLETLDDKGQSRYFSFNLAMGFQELMHELHRIFEESEEEYGSDTYKFIRKHLIRMSITVSKTPVGGAGGRKIGVLEYFDTVKERLSDERKCFYYCINKIKKELDEKIKQHDTMRAMYKTLPLQHGNYEMPLDRMKETEELFNIKLIVLANDKPKIVFDDESVKYTSYDSIKRKYHFLWKCYYYRPSGKEQDEVSSFDLAYPYITGKVCSYIIKGERYFLLMYYNDHYYMIYSLTYPKVCEKCGSQEHNVDDLKEPLVKLKCLENLKGFLDEEQLKLALPERVLIFFDYETFLMKQRQCPYMVSYIVCDPDLNILEKRTIEGFDCSRKFICEISRRYSHKLKYLIGFNSSSFDNYFVLMDMIKELTSKFSSNNSIIYKNKMLRLRENNIVTWDLYQFVKSPLRDACKAYQIDGVKGDVDHKEVWELFKLHDYKESVLDSQEYKYLNVKEYCENDVMLTMKLFKVVYNELYSVTGIDPLNSPTLSSLIYKYFDVKFKKITLKYDHVFSVPGGRTQVFQRGHFTGKFSLIDINSCYPYICIENRFGTGNVFEIDDTSDEEYVQKLLRDPETGEYRLYICLCDVDQTDLKFKLVGYKKDKYSTLDWTKAIVKDVWLQPEEIAFLEKHGCQLVKKKYLVWEKSEYALKDKMEILRDGRMKAKEEGNKVKELANKISANGQTGKCGEKNHDDVWEIALSEADVEKFKRRYPNSYTIDILKHEVFMMKGMDAPKELISKPRHMNARILSLSRLHLLEYAMLFEPHEVYYCDTDSLIVDDAALQRSIREGKIVLDKKKYGSMDLEATSDEIIIVSPKNYYMNDKKMSLKSYRDGDPWTAWHKNDKGDVKFTEGNNRCKEMYKCLLDDKFVVKTTFTKITKRIGKKDETGEIELAYLHTEETEKILE